MLLQGSVPHSQLSMNVPNPTTAGLESQVLRNMLQQVFTRKAMPNETRTPTQQAQTLTPQPPQPEAPLNTPEAQTVSEKGTASLQSLRFVLRKAQGDKKAGPALAALLGWVLRVEGSERKV